MGSVSSSFDHNKFLQFLSTNEEGCSNYTCCGLPLTDLHALLDHFEESHVLVLDHNTSNTAPSSALPTPVPTSDGFDLPPSLRGETDIELDSSDSPLGSGGSSSSASASASVSSQASSPHMGSQAALAPYYTDFRSLHLAGVESGPSNLSAQLSQQQPQQHCITPASLFSRSGSPTPGEQAGQTTISPSATTTTSPAGGAAATAANATNCEASSSKTPGSNATQTTTTLAKMKASLAKLDLSKFDPADLEEYQIVVSGPGVVHPGPPPPTQAPTSLSKPFKCPTAHCNKSYKQANGLKYHMTHGQCCFLPS